MLAPDQLADVLACARPGVAALASPSCQAVDWANFVVADEGLFVKMPLPEMAPFVDPAAAHRGAVAGMQAGVAPDVRFFVPETGALATSYLPPPWRAARLDDLRRPEILARVIAAKQAFRRGPALPRDWDVFDRIRAHVALAHATKTALPADWPALLDHIGAIEAAFAAAGRDSAPCHNDGQASNVMLGPDGQIMLVDFDCAGQADPHYDLAVILNEACLFDDEWRQGIEMQDGRCDQTALNRCRAYAVADDVLWGLWGLILSATSPRRDVEFLKYGEWRLLRGRMALRAPGFADRLRGL
jgi:hypothetical protein